MSYSKTASQPGFTLVEMLVVAPIVILVVGGIVALLIALVGDVLIARERNSMAYNTQDALNLIEQDVRLSSNIQATTGTPVSYTHLDVYKRQALWRFGEVDAPLCFRQRYGVAHMLPSGPPQHELYSLVGHGEALCCSRFPTVLRPSDSQQADAQ